MGILDNIIGQVTNRVKSDIEYKTSSGISNVIDQGTKKVVEKDNTPKCPKCKKQIEPGIKFCSSCGTKLLISCQKCQKDYQIGAKFCPDCGTSLG